MQVRREYTFDRVVRLIIGVLILIGLFLLVKRLSSVLLPFLIGWLIAYLMHPLVSFIQYRLHVKHRVLSIICAFCCISVFIALFVFLLGPQVVHEFARFGSLLSEYTADLEHNVQLPRFIKTHLSSMFDMKHIQQWLSLDNLQAVSEKILPSFWMLLSKTWRLVVGIFVVFIVLLYVFFILKDYEKISKGFLSLIPPKYKLFIEDLLNDVQSGMNRYFRGQGLIAFIVGLLFAAGFFIMGLPLGIIIGLFIGLLNMVPYLQTVGVVPVAMLCLLKSSESDQSFWILLLYAGIVFVVVQSIQDLILVPKIMGKAMGMNPAVILLSLSVWGSLLGIVGMIIALPMTTLLISYYRRFVINHDSILHETGKATESKENKIDK